MEQRKKSKVGNLFLNTVLFALGQFGSSILGVLLVPVYTNYMTTAEYGTADLVTNLVSMLIPVLTISIVDGIVKFSLDEEHRIDEVFSISCIICVIGIVASLIAYPLIVKYGEITGYVIIFYLILATRIISNLVLAYIKALKKLKLYTVIAVIKTLIMLLSNIVLLTVFNMGVKGYLLSFVISNFLSCLLAIISAKLWRYVKIGNIHKNTAKEMIRFSLPLIPNNFSSWAMSSMDKYMLTYMMGASYNGLYSVAHKIPSVISMFSSVFNQAWNYSALEEQNSNADKQRYYSTVFKIYGSYLFILASFIMILVKPVMNIWVGESFKGAWMYTPFLIMSTIFSCLTGFYVPIFVITKKTNTLFYSTMAGVMVNAVFNIILIPIWGINGASFATIMTHFTVYAIRGAIIERRTSFHFNKWKVYLNSLLLLIQSLTLMYIETYWFIWQLALILIVVIVNIREISEFANSLFNRFRKRY